VVTTPRAKPDEHLRQIRITVTVTGRVRDEDLNPRAREDLMDVYRRWQADRER
jgi:hypothetical protein